MCAVLCCALCSTCWVMWGSVGGECLPPFFIYNTLFPMRGGRGVGHIVGCRLLGVKAYLRTFVLSALESRRFV